MERTCFHLYKIFFRRPWCGELVALTTAAGLVARCRAATPLSTASNAPGLAFHITSVVRVYPGDVPNGQDDEVMRGRGIAVNNRSRVELLAFTPAPQGVTTDDYLIALDSGRVFVQHTNPARFTPASDQFGGPAVVALGRVHGRRGAAAAGGDPNAGRRWAGGGGGRGGRGGFGGRRSGGRAARAAAAGRGRGGLGSGFLNQLELLDVNFTIEKLGAGEVMEGHPTQHYRITTRLSRAVGRPELSGARGDRDLVDGASDRHPEPVRAADRGRPIDRRAADRVRAQASRGAGRRSRARRSRW